MNHQNFHAVKSFELLSNCIQLLIHCLKCVFLTQRSRQILTIMHCRNYSGHVAWNIVDYRNISNICSIWFKDRKCAEETRPKWNNLFGTIYQTMYVARQIILCISFYRQNIRNLANWFCASVYKFECILTIRPLFMALYRGNTASASTLFRHILTICPVFVQTVVGCLI